MVTKISIALAAFNGARYIREQLDSFLKQTRLPDELVIVDDCSDDATLEVVGQFSSEAPFPVRVLRNETNVGYTINFGRALELCTGDIVFLSDQDDVWLPDKLATVEQFFVTHPETLLVIHDIAYCRDDLTPIGQTKIERMRGVFDLYESYVVGMASAIRGEFLRRALPIPACGALAHDKWLHMCAQALGGKAVVEDMLALHRRHGANATAGSRLNVDYVTEPDHFEPDKVGFTTSLGRMVPENKRKWERSATLLQWLERNRKCLIEREYAGRDYIDMRIARERKWCEAAMIRQRILDRPRTHCLAMISRLYRSGGYDYYRGWKSAVGDLVFRCLFRL